MQSDPATLSVNEFAGKIGISRSTAYNLVRSRAVRSLKIGVLRRIPTTEVEAFLARKLAEQGNAA